jgi:phosphoribosylamine--glycine ligase
VNYRLLQTARDHKRALDGDVGPNTGGMGAFSPANNWTAELEDQFHKKIMRPLLDGLYEKTITFRGLLYPGLMISAADARVLEFNCRFGDPETQAILPLLTGDFLGALTAAATGELAGVELPASGDAAVTVVLASRDPLGAGDTGTPIAGVEDAEATGALVFHAGTALRGGNLVTNGRRILNVTGVAGTVADARGLAYAAIEHVSFEGMRYRSDIAGRAVHVG